MWGNLNKTLKISNEIVSIETKWGYLKSRTFGRLVSSRFGDKLAERPDPGRFRLSGSHLDPREDGLPLVLVSVLVAVAALSVVGDVERVKRVAVLNAIASLSRTIILSLVCSKISL